jgi:hypothetical protein
MRISDIITQIKKLLTPEKLIRFARIPKRIESVEYYQIRDGFK